MSEATGIAVLHVDDDPHIGDLIAEMLTAQDSAFTVETVTSAREGFDRLRTESFDCIVSDYDMPEQHGIDFLDRVRDTHSGMPFILYTGEGSEVVASDAIAAGVTDYLQKESGTSQYTILANKIRNAVEKHRHQKRARATRDRLRQIVDLLPQFIFAKDETGEFLLANEAIADAYGTTVGDIEGATDADFADSEEEVERFRADDMTVIESGERKHIPEEPLTTADGETRLLETTKIPYDPVETDGDAVLGVATDITERKTQEAQLEMRSAAMEAAIDGISILNADGEYIYMNRAHADIFGYDPDTLLGSSWRRLYGGDEIARIEQVVFPRLERAGEWRGETVGKRRDGAPVYQEITLSLLDDGKLICTNRDISGRKEREQELRMVRGQFEQFAGTVRDAFFLLPVDYSAVEYVNPAVETIYGVTPEEAYDDPRAWLRHVHPDDEDALLARVEAQQDGTVDWPIKQEFRIDHPDRGVRWVQARIDTIPDETGNPSRLAGITTDITDRKEQERAVRRNQAFLEQTQAVANVGGWDLDRRTDSLRWTDEVYRIHGVDPTFEPTVDDAIAFYHPDDRETVRDALERVTTTGEPHDLEARIVTDDDQVRWVRIRGEPRYEEGEVVGVRGTVQTITERIRRERQLEEQTEQVEQLATRYERQYRTLFEEAPVMTVLTRSEDGRPIIEDCNSQFTETLGYEADAVRGRELAAFYTPASVDRLRSNGYERSLDGQFTSANRDLRTADGAVVETLLRAVPRRAADGDVVGTVAMYIDITERESVKRANERLEAFTSVVSHDLRNPLNVATGRLELASDECDSEHLAALGRALRRMETLISDLLTLAREGREVTGTQLVPLDTMCDRCWETVETKQATLITDTDRGVQANNSRLRQVFENLFRNAIEHGGTDVTVTVGEIDGGFYVEDDGPGIPSGMDTDVFTAGYSGSTNGTGFGLSIVKQIVTAHDWQIRVTDGADGGARFEITDVEFVST